MSHAENLHTLHPAAGATDAIVSFVSELRHEALSEEVRHYARRHLLDTVGVMIAGAGGTSQPAPRRCLRRCGRPAPCRCRAARGAPTCSTPRSWAAPPRMASSSMTATPRARCIPGCTVIPACWPSASRQGRSGKALIEAVVAGYETVTAIGRACHPALRHRGFHPTGAVAVFGAAMATGKLRGLTARATRQRAGHRRLERGRPVRLRQRRRRHQAPACRPRRARRHAGGAAGANRASRARPA